MINKIILASKSGVRKKILEENGFNCLAKPANIDEESIKESLKNEGATPLLISKNLAELKANKISKSLNGEIVIGADSVIDLEGYIISKPTNREEALTILKKLNGKVHNLISSICVSRNGQMMWNYSEKAELVMKNLNDNELKSYLSKITDAALYAYNVYQIEGEGKNLFSKINGDKDTIMGIPVKKLKEYLNNLK